MPNLTNMISEVPPFLENSGKERLIFDVLKHKFVFRQGETSGSLFYLRRGVVKITIVSDQGKNAVLAVLRGGVFFGEDALSGQGRRRTSALTMTDCSITMIESATFARRLQDDAALSRFFIAHLLDRNLQIEEDRVDQIFNCSEKRLARALILLTNASNGVGAVPAPVKVSQETLSEMVGTTRSRVSFFMNRFRRLGFISYEGGLEVHPALLSFLGLGPQHVAAVLAEDDRPLVIAPQLAGPPIGEAAHRTVV